MKKVFRKIRVFFINVYSFLSGLLLGRSKKNVLIGAWGGNKFSDNSRYLYQYLFFNKKKLGLKTVVWATRNEQLNANLNNAGYNSVLIGTKTSKLWHLKCGIHIICNMSFDFSTFQCDIDNRYSCGAKKIQLWHGVGVKAIGNASNASKARQKRKHHGIVYSHFLRTVFSCGCWHDASFLCTSNLNKKNIAETMDCNPKRLFVSSYPRNCRCLELTADEKSVVEKIKSFPFVCLYLPTFRSNYTNYIHPLDDDSFVDFLASHDVLFIEKPHSAETMTSVRRLAKNVIHLESNFDINVLFPYISCLVSDYSSAAFDSIHLNIPTLFYTPDLETFKNGDVGLLIDFEKTFEHLVLFDIDNLVSSLQRVIKKEYFSKKTNAIFDLINHSYFNNCQKNYKEIWKDILNSMKN